MAGANYMGGTRSVVVNGKSLADLRQTLSRNAAKARSKDTTKRTQKNFFGHQRLNILARDFKHARAGDLQLTGKSKIGLAHAKRDLAALSLPEVALSNSLGSTPACHETKGGLIDRLDGDNKRPVSQVLDALDTSERVC
jgi:hypothetical protein